MIIALTGSNDYLLKRRLDELVAEFIQEHGEFAVERIDASEADSQVILDAVNNLPFLASRKMVVVRELGSNREAAEIVEQIISSENETCDVVLYEPSPDKRSRYYKILQKSVRLEILNDMDAGGLTNWLVLEAKSRGGELSSTDAKYLIERTGPNQVMLSNELNKLLAYEAQIKRAGIDLLTEPSPQSKIFDLLDAAFGGNKSRALELYEEQRAQKVEPQIILSMLGRQLQLITLTKLGEGKTAAAIAADAGQHPYPVNKAANLARKLGKEQLRQMVDGALEIDVKSKTSSIDLDEALKTYIANL